MFRCFLDFEDALVVRPHTDIKSEGLISWLTNSLSLPLCSIFGTRTNICRSSAVTLAARLYLSGQKTTHLMLILVIQNPLKVTIWRKPKINQVCLSPFTKTFWHYIFSWWRLLCCLSGNIRGIWRLLVEVAWFSRKVRGQLFFQPPVSWQT